MVSKASDDFPEPLGPVTTVNLPSGRSTSTPLRLFCRAPRTSTQSAAAAAVTHVFSAPFDPTEHNYGDRHASQLSSQRSMIHFSTRILSPKPGHKNFPSSPLRNQLTLKMSGGLLSRFPIAIQWRK